MLPDTRMRTKYEEFSKINQEDIWTDKFDVRKYDFYIIYMGCLDQNMEAYTRLIEKRNTNTNGEEKERTVKTE